MGFGGGAALFDGGGCFVSIGLIDLENRGKVRAFIPATGEWCRKDQR